MAKRELLATIRDRYRASSKHDKTRILDEFVAVTGHHRKHAIGCCGDLTMMNACCVLGGTGASTMKR